VAADPDKLRELEAPKRDGGERELWPEVEAELSTRARARGYLREHPGVMWGLILGVIVVVVAVTLVGHYYATRESTDDAEIDGHIAPVSARIAGTVVNVHVDDNQFVERGTVLVELDPKDYQVALEKANADLADAEAAAAAARTGVPVASANTASALATANASVAAAEKEADAAQAQLRRAQADWTKAKADVDRYTGLYQKQEISRQQYDSAVAQEEMTRASVESARASVSAAQSRVVQSQAQVRAAQTAPQQVQIIQSRAGSAGAQVEQKRAAVQQAELALQYTTVVAPVSGIISKRNVEPGQVVQPGQPLVSIVNLEDLWTTANFKETQLKKMQVGQRATIQVDAYGAEYKGHVDSIGGATGARFSLLPPENATGNFVKVVQRVPVKIVFEKGQDVEHKLRPGMSVVPTVLTK
jgi:membrane fusion protein (multidrug efflux system)